MFSEVGQTDRRDIRVGTILWTEECEDIERASGRRADVREDAMVEREYEREWSGGIHGSGKSRL